MSKLYKVVVTNVIREGRLIVTEESAETIDVNGVEYVSQFGGRYLLRSDQQQWRPTREEAARDAAAELELLATSIESQAERLRAGGEA
jgi:hypothetical protein